MEDLATFESCEGRIRSLLNEEVNDASVCARVDSAENGLALLKRIYEIEKVERPSIGLSWDGYLAIEWDGKVYCDVGNNEEGDHLLMINVYRAIDCYDSIHYDLNNLLARERKIDHAAKEMVRLLRIQKN
jgi:hypothetical protein